MTPFLKNNILIYFILVNILIGLIYILTILLIVMSIRIKNKKLNILWPLSILRFCLPFFSICFFGQCFLLLTTIFDCQNGFAYVSKKLVCRTGTWFMVDAPLAGVGMALHAILAVVTNTLYYKSTFVLQGSDVLKKTNCIPDVVLLFTKIFVIILFILDDGNEDEHWAVLFFLNLITGVNAFCNYYFQNRQNKQLCYINNILCLMPFLGFFSLLVGKIFKSLGFNGSIFLFYVLLVFGVLFILFFKKKEINFALINYKNIDSPRRYLNYIHKFHSIVMNKNNSRNDFIILKSLIAKKEEKCFDNNCPLKVYVDNPNDEVEDIFPLLEFCEKLFEFGISKFSNDISLKINYSLFLIFEMNKKKKALIILNSINWSIYSFQDNYNIFRCQRLIDEYILNKSKNKNIINSFEYKKKVDNFKLLISTITSLYNNFWHLIIINKLNATNNFEGLNSIGSQIIELNKEIENEYNNLIKIKYDNYHLINFYSYFKENISNDKEKLKKNGLKSQKSENNNNSHSYEIQFSNFDINILKEKDLFKYLILSGKKEDLGNIIDISLNLSPIFGYKRNELLGKNINILIPEIFQNMHDKLLVNYSEKYKSSFYKELFRNDIYIPEFLEKPMHAISKSKFLIPIKLKVYFVQNEGDEFIYIVEVNKIKDYQQVLDKHEENKLKCIILTDDDFHIKSFTPNCINHLMLSDFHINSNYNIINYIKQLKNEYQNKINEVNKGISLNSSMKNYSSRDKSERKNNYKVTFEKNITYSQKKKIKKELIENYLKEKEITWKININKNYKQLNEENNFNHSLINFKDNSILWKNDENVLEMGLIMHIKRITISGELVGYYFILYNKLTESLFNNNFVSSNISRDNKQRRDSTTGQKKYQFLFQIQPKKNKKKYAKYLVKKEEIKISKSPKNIIKPKSLDYVDFLSCKNVYFKGLEKGYKSSKKSKSSKSINFKHNSDTEEENKDYIQINEKYIPECPFNFIFDINNRSYKPVYDIKKETNSIFIDVLKFQASKKQNAYETHKENKERKTHKSNDDSNESEESENEEKELSSSSISSETPNSLENTNKNISDKEIKINSSKNNDINNNNENVIERKKSIFSLRNDYFNKYYKVNLSKINFSIYDFNKDMIVESTTDKIPKIENIFKIAISNSETPITIKNHIIVFNNNKEEKKRMSSKRSGITEVKMEKLSDQKKIENKIKEAINKEEDEEKIVIIHKWSLILLFFLLVCSSLFLYFEISSYKDYNIFLGIIKNIISINYCNKMGLYFIRELTLLNIPDTEIINGQYIAIPARKKTEYNEFIKSVLLELFVESQLAMIDFMGTTISISEKNDNFLVQTKLITKLSNSDLKGNNINNNIIITIVQLNSAFYNLISSTSPVQQNHADLYNFVYNSLNNFNLAINLLIDTYIQELHLKIQSYKLIIKIQLYIYLTIYIISYIISLCLFSKIITRKKNYMKIFLNIDYNFITQSIDKCEQFINKFKLSEEIHSQDKEIEESYEEQNSLLSQEKQQTDISLRRNSVKLRTTNIENRDNTKRNFQCSKNLIFKIFLGIFFLLMYLIYYLFGFLYFFNLNKKVFDISKFYFHLQQFHLNIIDYYNIYREYLFDSGALILNEIPYNNLIIKEKFIYGNWTIDINNITSYINSLIKDKDIRNQLNESLCSYNITDYFKDENDCIKEVGNSYKQDIYSFSYGFVDEIRIKKNIIRVISDMGMIIGNLTEYETETWHEKYYELLNNETREDLTVTIRFRLQLFNDGYFHTISNIYFINIILPCFNKNRKIIFKYITIVGAQNIYYLLYIISIIGLLIIYFFFWIPKLKSLKRVTYDTKNMLKIIPVNILMADINIKNLLYISLNKK